MTIFLTTMEGRDEPVIQATLIAKLLGIRNVTQFLTRNNIDAVKGGDGRSHPWHVTVQGAMAVLIKKDFGGCAAAAEIFYSMQSATDAERVCAALAVLEDAATPGLLNLKPRGRKTRKEAKLRLA